jgi:hypothetical protein
MQSRTRSELPLFRTVHGLGCGQCGPRLLARFANYEEKQTVVGIKRRGMCSKASAQRIVERRRRRGRAPSAFSARIATLLGTVAPGQ